MAEASSTSRTMGPLGIRPDVAIAILLAGLGIVVSLWGSHQIGPALASDRFIDVWFDADVARVSKNMNGLGDHHRTSVHPLFSLLTAVPVVAVRKLFHLSPTAAACTVIAMAAGLWLALLFAVLRGMGCRRIDSVLLCSLAVTSAGSLFWFTVPETYLFGSITILAAMGLAVLSSHRRVADRMILALSVLTLAVTITNWMAGLIVAFTQRRWGRAIAISGAALVIVLALAVVQKRVFPTARFLFNNPGEEIGSVAKYSTGGPLVVGKVFFLDTIFAPRFAVSPYPGQPDHTLLLVAQRRPAGATPFGGVGLFFWIPLFALGLWSLYAFREQPSLRITLAALLAGQFLLHVFYGPESFLYTGHWLPLLILVTAFATLGRFRTIAIGLITVVSFCAALNNFTEFERAATHIRREAAAESARSSIVPGGQPTAVPTVRVGGIQTRL